MPDYTEFLKLAEVEGGRPISAGGHSVRRVLTDDDLAFGENETNGFSDDGMIGGHWAVANDGVSRILAEGRVNIRDMAPSRVSGQEAVRQPDPDRGATSGPSDAPKGPPLQSLLGRLGDGHNSPAWSEFVRLYTPLLQYWLRPHLHQPLTVDEVVQDVMVVVMSKLPEFTPAGPGAFAAWLRAILSYRLQTFWRKKLGRHEVGAFDAMLAGIADSASELAHTWDEEHDRHVIGGLLDVVKPRFRSTTWQAFWRTAILDEPSAQVAKTLRITPQAVFVARCRVMETLRKEAAGLVNES